MISPNKLSGTYNVEPRWLHIPDAAVSRDRIKLNLLYIGHQTATKLQLACKAEKWFSASNLEEAYQFINEVGACNSKLPDVLFIDVSVDRKELERFVKFLNDEGVLSRMLLFYNRKRLSSHQINSLRQVDIIDDVIDFDASGINYQSKIHFVKRAKKEEKRKTGKGKTAEDAFQSKFNKPLTLGVKRLIDILLSSMLIALSLPVFVVLSAAIRYESKGPIFYTSKRAGRGFHIFDFYKFRSMVPDADKKIESLSHLNQYAVSDQGPKFMKICDDPRITRFGKFLRNTSLDELPQLFNVLKGDMSLVGNRPLPIYEAVTLTTNDFVERFSAPAGITGLWQVNKRGKEEMSPEERINLDIQYSKSYSSLVDLKIMIKTPLALFQKTNV